MIPILKVSGIGPQLAASMAEKGITTADQLATTLPVVLREIPGIGAHRAETLLTAAKQALEGDPSKPPIARKAPVPSAIAEEVEMVTEKKTKGKKAKSKKEAKKKKLKEKAAAKKAAKEMKLKKKVAAKKAAKKKAEKKAVKKKAKATKGKKNGKPRKK